VSAAGAGALGLEGGPVQETEAIAPLLLAGAVGIAAGTAGGIAFGATFGGPDPADVASSLSWQNTVDEYTRSREDRLLVDQTLASLKRDVQLVENKAREQAIFKVFEAGVDGLSESDATTAAQTAVDETYAVVEKAILKSFSQRVARADAVMQMLGADYWGTSQASELQKRDSDSGGQDGANVTNSTFTGGTSIGSASHTLFDGSTITYNKASGKPSSSADTAVAFDPVSWRSRRDDTSLVGVTDQFIMLKPDPADYSNQSDPLDVSYDSVMFLNGKTWGEIYEDLDSAYQSMSSEVSSIVSSYFTPAQNGEISLNEAVGPKYLTDSAQTAKDFEEAAQALRAMGYPLSDQKVTVELPTESGGTIEVIGRLAWTAHNGNGLVVGQTLNFQNFPGSLMAAVNTPEGQRDSSTDYPGAEQIEITGEFTILTAEGADKVTFTDRSLAEADATTNSEINKIYKENYDANKEATSKIHDTATSGSSVGGGGGFLDGFGGSSNLGILAAGGAVLVYLLGNNN
jgi:hypothetical protein